MTTEELQDILEKHRLWMEGNPAGKYADLRKADLRYADLRGADLRNADLHGADLRGADLRNADLHGADLRDADLRDADLRDAKNYFYPLACPDTGSFIGWKKCSGNLIVKLKILKDAKRTSATGRKCRCSAAKVLSVENPDGSPAETDTAYSNRDSSFAYTVGKIVKSEFDENRWNECASGIHFFITREEAVKYRF